MHSKIQNRKSAIPIIPDGLEPSFPGCKPGVVAAGPRDRIGSGLTGTRTRHVPIEKWLACDACIFLLDHESFMSSGSRGTRTHNGPFSRNCVRAVFHYRGPRLFLPHRSAAGPCFRADDFYLSPAAVAGIEPATRRLTVAFPYQHRTHRNRRIKEER